MCTGKRCCDGVATQFRCREIGACLQQAACQSVCLPVSGPRGAYVYTCMRSSAGRTAPLCPIRQRQHALLPVPPAAACRRAACRPASFVERILIHSRSASPSGGAPSSPSLSLSAGTSFGGTKPMMRVRSGPCAASRLRPFLRFVVAMRPACSVATPTGEGNVSSDEGAPTPGRLQQQAGYRRRQQ